MKLPALKEIIDERREKAVETLSSVYAKNRLPLEEYERLVEYINKIESERELVVVEKIVAEYSNENDNGGYSEKAAKPEKSVKRDESPDNYPRNNYRSRAYANPFNNLALFSSRQTEGSIRTGSQFVSILGSQHIKLTKADLAQKQTFLEIVSLLGEVVIFVEPGIRVINKAVPVLGGAWTNNKVNRQAQSSGPELFISGAAILGNISIKVLKEK